MKEKKPGTYYRERSANQGLCLQGDRVLTKTVFGRCVPPLACVLPPVPLSLPALESPPALLSLILSKIKNITYRCLSYSYIVTEGRETYWVKHGMQAEVPTF